MFKKQKKNKSNFVLFEKLKKRSDEIVIIHTTFDLFLYRKLEKKGK